MQTEQVQEIKLFQEAPAVKKALMQYGILKSFKEGEAIVNEDAYIRSIPIVLSGNIKVMQTDESGHELLLYFIEPGESCIMSFLGGIHHEKSKVKAVAEEPTEILLIPVDKVQQFIKDYPQWLDYIFRLYHKRFEELLQVVNAVAFTRIDERLLQLLKKKAELSQNKVINITHEQLATELGSARTVISRLLKQLEQAGHLKLSRNRITLL
ncbi:MAG TPA: Crp/Fnr family transcriptional regulator [Chitinophagaceae bacterium]